MGFDIVGQYPKTKTGRYFRNNVWWWRPLQVLVTLACADQLTAEEAHELGFNDGFPYSADKAAVIAKRLREITSDDEKLESYRQQVVDILPGSYSDCWSKENVIEFAEFLEDSGGFEVW